MRPFSKHPDSPQSAWLGWAVFLGMSWTWCIGMFLPVLLVHDYGVWAWVMFALPNIVGAAAMGWVLDAQRSRLMVRAHRQAITIFSAVTVAFQIFFAVWIFSQPPWQAANHLWYLIGVALVAAVATARKSSRLLAILILVASAGCVIGMFQHGEAGRAAAGVAANLSAAPPADLAWLAPVYFIGFLFSPYLDATFHRARQHMDDRHAKLSFTLGFGAIFCAAILISLLYAKPVYAALHSHEGIGLNLRWIKVYWMLQLGFTIGLHFIGDDMQNRETQARRAGVILVAGIVIAAIALAAGAALKIPGENLYWSFLGFYGLVFPAYVWLCMIPGRGVLAPTGRPIVVLALAIAIALPMFFLAFIGHRLFWAAPGMAVVLLARLFLSKSAGKAQPAAAVAYIAQQNSAPTS